MLHILFSERVLAMKLWRNGKELLLVFPCIHSLRKARLSTLQRIGCVCNARVLHDGGLDGGLDGDLLVALRNHLAGCAR